MCFSGHALGTAGAAFCEEAEGGYANMGAVQVRLEELVRWPNNMSLHRDSVTITALGMQTVSTVAHEDLYND